MKSKKVPTLHHDWIDSDAIEIVDILQRKGFTTYLVGGCVRDLLVGIHPKDFDIATNASPQEVKRYIPKSYIIGKRFRLVLVRRGDRQFEVATFRKNYCEDDFPGDEEPPPGDNIFGSPEEDASRRDFTINAMFYDPNADEIIDYTTGLDDIERRFIQVIGEPEERFIEDPIRILRAIRLAHKVGFSIQPEAKIAIQKTAQHLTFSVLPRRREEILKILRLPSPDLVFQDLHDLGALEFLSPTLFGIYNQPEALSIFRSYLLRCPQLVCDSDDPLDLFSVLVLAYLRSTTHPNPTDVVNANRFLENATHMHFLKEELGLFKYEQSKMARALQTCQTLLKTKDFQRKGDRRQMALLKSDSFPLTLKIAQFDFLLPPEDLDFWLQTYEKARPEIERELELKIAKKKKRRPRRRTKKPQKH